MSVYICGTRVPVLASIPLRSVLSPSILHSTPIQVRKDEDLLLLLEEETLRPASTPVDSTLVHSTPILRSSRPGSGVCVCVAFVFALVWLVFQWFGLSALGGWLAPRCEARASPVVPRRSAGPRPLDVRLDEVCVFVGVFMYVMFVCVFSSVRSFFHSLVCLCLVPSGLRSLLPASLLSFVRSFVRSCVRSFVRSFGL